MTITNSSASIEEQRRVPGGIPIWTFCIGDMLMFSLFFAYYFYDRSNDVDTFNASQLELSLGLGAVNTFLLLTGSLFVVLGMLKYQAGQVSRYFDGALLCAAGFGVNKVIEYSQKVSHDLTPDTNQFFQYYYMLTGIHALHLLIGMALLWRMRALARTLSASGEPFIRMGAVYWHLVDLLWILIFPVLYIVH